MNSIKRILKYSGIAYLVGWALATILSFFRQESLGELFFWSNLLISMLLLIGGVSVDFSTKYGKRRKSFRDKYKDYVADHDKALGIKDKPIEIAQAEAFDMTIIGICVFALTLLTSAVLGI